MGLQRVRHDWVTNTQQWKRQVLTTEPTGNSTVIFKSLVVVQSVSRVWLFVTPWTAARQVSLSFTNSRSLLKLMSMESVMPSNHLILCHPLLLLPSIFPSMRVFSNNRAQAPPSSWTYPFIHWGVSWAGPGRTEHVVCEVHAQVPFQARPRGLALKQANVHKGQTWHSQATTSINQ